MKTRLLTEALLGWFSLATPAAALTSADFLLHLCDSDDVSERFACSAYITGALEMSAGSQNYWHAESPKTYCAPDMLDSDIVEKLWGEELAVMPAEVKADAALILYLAVMDKFLCPDQVPQ